MYSKEGLNNILKRIMGDNLDLSDDISSIKESYSEALDFLKSSGDMTVANDSEQVTYTPNTTTIDVKETAEYKELKNNYIDRFFNGTTDTTPAKEQEVHRLDAIEDAKIKTYDELLYAL